MKYLLRQMHGQLFVQEAGSWTEDPTQARQFPSALAAFIFSVEQAPMDVEVVEMPGSQVEDPNFVSAQR